MINHQQQTISKQYKKLLEISVSQQNQQEPNHCLNLHLKNDSTNILNPSIMQHQKIAHQPFKSRAIKSKNKISVSAKSSLKIEENDFQVQSHLEPKQTFNKRINKTEIIEVEKDIPRKLFLDHLVSTPKQKLESFKYQLKTMRRENDSYLRNKMNVIKQKIKIKLNRGNVSNEGTKVIQNQNKTLLYEPNFESPQKKVFRKEYRSVEKDWRNHKIEKYDPKFEEEVVRKGISIQRCHPLTVPTDSGFSTQIKKDSFQKQLKLNVEEMQDRILVKKQSTIPNYILRGAKNYKTIFRNASFDWQTSQQNLKMIHVSRFTGMNSILSVMKQENREQISNIELPTIEEHTFRNKVIQNSVNPQMVSKKYNKSLDTALMRKVEKKLSKQTVTHNFIKGSLYYKLLKKEDSIMSKVGKIGQRRKMEEVEDVNISQQIQQEQKMEKKKETIEEQTVVEIEQGVKKKIVVVVSNKNITRYKQKFNRKNVDNQQQQPGNELFYKNILSLQENGSNSL